MKKKNQKKENVILKKVVKYSGAVAIIIIFGIMFTFGIFDTISNSSSRFTIFTLLFSNFFSYSNAEIITVAFAESASSILIFLLT